MGKGLFKAAAIMIFSLFVVSCCHGNKQINLNAYKTKAVKAKDATVFITVKGEGSEELLIESSGSGVAVAHVGEKTVIMTAGHICKAPLVPGVESAEFMTWNIKGKGYYSSVIAISPHFDVCLLSVDEILPIAKIAKTAPSSGDRVYYSGYPVGFYMPGLLHHFEGYMAGIDPTGDHMYNIPAIGGSSGSPVYNKKGEIVGILSAVMVEFHWMTFAVGTENILDFMENSGYEVR
tara:strand:- start:162 stop:863 length:702 start_codon:yes stop_codon:yes gene_type:complete